MPEESALRREDASVAGNDYTAVIEGLCKVIQSDRGSGVLRPFVWRGI